MSEILNKVREVDPNNSDAVKEVLTSFFQNIVKHTAVNCNQWLRSLDDVLSRFPRYCSTHKTTIETHLTHFINSSNYYDVIQAAKCAHALQQVPWPQNNSITAKSAWRDQMTLLCDAAHSLIDALFIDTVELNKKGSKQNNTQKDSISPLTAALSEINFTASAGTTNRQTLLETRLRNVFIFIQAMIVDIYPVPKPIQPQTILNVIVSSLSATSGKKSQVTDVGSLKIEALRTLDALNACLGANLIPFSPLVFRIVMQTFRWTSDNQTDGSRQVRCHSYNSLSNWLTTLHSHRLSGHTWEDEIAIHIIDDTTPMKKTVELTMTGGQPLKNLSKKARRKLQNQMLKESTIATHIPGEKNKVVEFEEIKNDISMAALSCAEIFLSVCGVFLKPTTHKLFQEHLVHECFNTTTYSDEYVLALLRTLEASRKTAPATLPPPTQYCLQLYSTLSNNQCIKIARFCSQALLDIRMHLHCSPPSLNFALEVPKEKNPVEKSKFVSERNIKALKKLLGKDRMPNEDNIEVITIHDEPTKKRPRLDPDNISVSSESVCSIEISDDDDEVTEELEIEKNEKTKEVTNNVDENVDMQAGNTEQVDGTTIEIENQRVDLADKTEVANDLNTKVTSIYDAKTQLETNISNDDVDEDNQTLSMEVAYDLPTAVDKVRVLEQVDDDNLPSTNDTDDVQITCGQIAQTSQEIDKTKESDEITLDDKEGKATTEPDNTSVVITIDDAASSNKAVNNEEVINVDGTNNPEDDIVTIAVEKTNGNINEMITQVPANNITDKLSKPDDVSVDDMMADFVDEVNDQTEEA
ncbi:PREDICTED: uncharacterized protein LOC106121363 [Papilio xuthus]|uniref:Uncharacterized protein LOC106121363 n=1 Tax=Papilio xuthus TaxID=66420 RepID=A0AAJ6ZH22_PAPXU|nr:PREDICTED: uncharacterized protein LOC106121363 [Papilio xuthus]